MSSKKVTIKSITAREILTAGAYPTLQVKVVCSDGSEGHAACPFGISAGAHEAAVIFDGDKNRYLGQGMLQAVKIVTEVIAPKLLGQDPTKQQELDRLMIELDGTPNKSKLGGNAILPTSLAISRAAAAAQGLPLYLYLRGIFGRSGKVALPKPTMVLIEGGKHTAKSADFQDYLIAPIGFPSVSECVRAGAEIYLTLAKNMKTKGFSSTTGTSGAFSPEELKDNEQPIKMLLDAIEVAGYTTEQVKLALDCAATELYQDKRYYLRKERRILQTSQMVDAMAKLVDAYPIMSIEDPLAEDDWEGWQALTARIGDRVKVIGDDLTVTNPLRLQQAIDAKAINAIIVKPNQIGTLSETVQTMELADAHGLMTVVSDRGGGDTNDAYIVDLAVAMGAAYLKVGVSRGERVIKYNRLTEIDAELNHP